MLTARELPPELAPPVGDADPELDAPEALEPVAEAPCVLVAPLLPEAEAVEDDELPAGTAAAMFATEAHLAWEFVEASPSV